MIYGHFDLPVSLCARFFRRRREDTYGAINCNLPSNILGRAAVCGTPCFLYFFQQRGQLVQCLDLKIGADARFGCPVSRVDPAGLDTRIDAALNVGA